MLFETVLGFCVGVVARFIIRDSPGMGADTLAGIVGGGLGGWIYLLFGHKYPFDDTSAWGLVAAAAGAVIVILVTRATAGRRTVA
jgi:uncharacterized membrane protein YeaQ/YmgE (transglycosylase-associated protein family)